MKLRPEEITAILKDRIREFDVETDLSEVGTVLQVGDGIARIHGLENCVALERLDLPRIEELYTQGSALRKDDPEFARDAADEALKLQRGDPASRAAWRRCPAVQRMSRTRAVGTWRTGRARRTTSPWATSRSGAWRSKRRV